MSEGADRLRRIEDAILGLSTQMGAMQATLTAHLRQQAERTANRDAQCADHEARIRAVEQIGADEHGDQIEALQGEVRKLREWRAKLAGIAAAIGAGVGTPLGAVAVIVTRAVTPHQ